MTNEMDIRAAINIRLTSIKILKILVMKPLFLYSLQKEWFNETTNIIMKKIIGKKYSYENFLKTILLFPVISQINCSKPGIAGIVLSIPIKTRTKAITFAIFNPTSLFFSNSSIGEFLTEFIEL